jgi:hypothetical protein
MCIFLKAQSLHKHDKENAFNFPYHLAWCYMSNISSQILQTYFQYVVSEKQTTPPVYLLDRRLSSPALRRTFLQTLHGFQPAELKMHRFNISISMSWFICIGTNVFRILSLWVKQYNNPNMTQCKECDQWALGSIGFLKPINLPLSACPSGFWSLPHICPLFESTLGTKMQLVWQLCTAKEIIIDLRNFNMTNVVININLSSASLHLLQAVRNPKPPG